MMNLQKHLSRKLNSLCLLLLIPLTVSCNGEPETKEYIARVNDSYLTMEELSSMVDTSVSSELQTKVIKDWIYREMLYQEAAKKGITTEEQFDRIISKSKRELAAAMVLQNESSIEDLIIDEKEFEKYYNEKQNNFKLHRESFLINRIDFNNEESAINFRNKVLDGSWEKALAIFQNNEEVLNSDTEKIVSKEDVHPASLARILDDLYPQELSIVISGKPGYYSLAQLITKFRKGTIPEYKFIKEEVKKRFLAEKQKDLIRKYLDDLYSESEIEVKLTGIK